MEKIHTALSNNVTIVGDKIHKEIVNDTFKTAFGAQEDKGLLAHGISFNLIHNGFELERIEHEP
jgi:hypothetical protein